MFWREYVHGFIKLILCDFGCWRAISGFLRFFDFLQGEAEWDYGGVGIFGMSVVLLPYGVLRVSEGALACDEGVDVGFPGKKETCRIFSDRARITGHSWMVGSSGRVGGLHRRWIGLFGGVLFS